MEAAKFRINRVDVGRGKTTSVRGEKKPKSRNIMNQRLIILHTYRLTNKHWFIFITFNSRCAAKNKYEIINSVLKTACLGRYRKYKYKVNSKHYGTKPLCTDRALRNNKLGMYIKGPMAKGKWKDEYKTVDMDHGALPNLHLVKWQRKLKLIS